jgi:predicted DNA-binding transcriptional regulator AlpA
MTSAKSRSAALPAPLGGARFLSSKEVMKLLGYSDLSGFWAAVRTAGIPFIKVTPRRFLFEENSLRAWLKSRTVGRVA